ncbi:MAG: hypothetical protein AMXMBFR66_31930 [Pseudomonadota bacterium]
MEFRHAGGVRLQWLAFLLLFQRGGPREPLHGHVRACGSEARLWLELQVRVAASCGPDASALREVVEVAQVNREQIERAWHDDFGPGQCTSTMTQVALGQVAQAGLRPVLVGQGDKVGDLLRVDMGRGDVPVQRRVVAGLGGLDDFDRADQHEHAGRADEGGGLRGGAA